MNVEIICAFEVRPEITNVQVTGDNALLRKRIYLQKQKHLFSSTVLWYFGKAPLKIPANCSSNRVPLLNEAVAKYRKTIPFHKRGDKRLSDIKKGLVFTISAAPEIADELILAQYENRLLNLRKVMSHMLILLH